MISGFVSSQSLMLVLAIVVLILLIIGITKLIPSKGEIGEKSMASRLERLPKEYMVLNDVIISAFGKPTQIDHIVVSPYAIFVIETKNHKGKIYGDEDAQYWTQDIYGKKYKQYNPIFQNRTHISILQKMLNFHQHRDLPYISIVAYTNRSSLYVRTENGRVMHVCDVVDYIKIFETKKINDEEVKNVANCIEKHREIGKTAKKRVIHSVIKGKEREKNALFNGICPRCGGELVKRKGNYGNFWGCANFPRCKYTKDIE